MAGGTFFSTLSAYTGVNALQADQTVSIPNTKLVQARLDRNLTQQELASRLDVTQVTIGRWERGVTLPSPFYRRKLCQVFGKTAQELGLSCGKEQTVLSDPAVPLLGRNSPANLVGRAEMLRDLKGQLTGGSSPLLFLALSGLPGVGKTTLAVALAHDPQIREHFADGILWVGLGPTPDIMGQLARWGALLGVSLQGRATRERLGEWSLALREALWQRRVLLVIDDAWTYKDALTFRVGGPQCSYLLTTRFSDLATQFAGWDGAMSVAELSAEEGMDLLAELAPMAVKHHWQACKKLVQAVGGLPLALTLMGKYLRKQGSRPRRIETALLKLLDAQQRLHITHPQGMLDTHTSLAPGAALSLQAVIGASSATLGDGAHQALAALAVFPPKPNSFSEEAALAVGEDSGAEIDTLDTLVDAGLLEERGHDRLCLHQTIADYALHILMREGKGKTARSRMVAYFTDYVEGHARDYEALEQESANILAALHIANDIAVEQPAAVIRLVTNFYPYLLTRGLYASAQEYLLRAESAARAVDEPATLSRILLQLGEIAQKQGRYEEAITYCQEGLGLARAIGQSELITPLLATLGWVESSKGNYTQAEIHLQEGLRLARNGAQPEHLCTLLMSLGALAISLGDYAQAESYFQEGLGLARQMAQHERVSVTLTGLGIMADLRGDYAQAEAYLQEGLALARQIDYRERIAIILLNLGVLEDERGDYARAKRYDEEALALARALGHGELITVLLSNLGEMAYEQGKYEQADAYTLEGLASARQMGYRDRIGALLLTLGLTATSQGNYAQAEAYLQEGLALARQLAQRDIESRLLRGRGVLLLKQGRFQEAEQVLVVGVKKARGVGNCTTLCELLCSWGEALLGQGRIAEAEGALEEMTRHLPESQKLSACRQYALARIVAAQGRMIAARTYAARCLAMFEAMGHALAPVVRDFLQRIPQDVSLSCTVTA